MRAHAQGGGLQRDVAMVTEHGGTSCHRVYAEVCVSFTLSLCHQSDLFQLPPHERESSHRKKSIEFLDKLSFSFLAASVADPEVKPSLIKGDKTQ